jgi:hypothetical protein
MLSTATGSWNIEILCTFVLDKIIKITVTISTCNNSVPRRNMPEREPEMIVLAQDMW